MAPSHRPPTSPFCLAQEHQLQAIMSCKEHDARVGLSAAHQVLLSPELLGHLLCHLDNGNLARSARVNKFWYWESAKYLWVTCNRLDNLKYNVRPEQHDNVASFIRNLDLDYARQLWNPTTSPSMPDFPNLRSLNIHADFLSDPWDPQLVSQLIPAALEQLSLTSAVSHVTSPAYNTQGIPIMDTSWLQRLRRNCRNLRAINLNVNLAPSSQVELELLLLSALVERLHLGPLLDSIIDDWTMSIILSNERLCVLEMHKPLTLDVMKILRDQCNGPPPLHNLQHLTATFNSVDAEQTMAALLPSLVNLTFLDILIDHTPDGNPWSPTAAVFHTIGQLANLRFLSLSIRTYTAIDDNGERIYTAITGADLVALSRLPLNYLSIQPHYNEVKYSLELREVTGADLLHVLRRWEWLEDLELDMVCKEVVCGRQQAQSIQRLIFSTPIHCFRLNKYTIVDNLIDPQVWLGRNTSFYPDPLPWKPRQLYHSGPARDIKYLADKPEEANDLVWGAEHEDDDDVDLATEDLIKNPSNEKVALVETSAVTGSVTGVPGGLGKVSEGEQGIAGEAARPWA